MKRSCLFIILLFSAFLPNLEARTRWGIGLSVGTPTILAHLAIPAGEYIGIDVDFGWSAWDITNSSANGSSIYGIMDIIAWNPTIGTPQVRFLAGIGVAVGMWIQKHKTPSDGFFAGLRIPLGFEWIPDKNFESFIKLGPGVLLFPNSSFRADIVIGGRYIF